jgi:hypothetical protein
VIGAGCTVFFTIGSSMFMMLTRLSIIMSSHLRASLVMVMTGVFGNSVLLMKV